MNFPSSSATIVVQRDNGVHISGFRLKDLHQHFPHIETELLVLEVDILQY